MITRIARLSHRNSGSVERSLEHSGTSGLSGLSPAGRPNLPHRLFRQLLKEAELPAIRWYDLRHSHATLLIAAGEHPKVVQERLGHSSIQLTLDTYSRVVPGMQDRATDRLEALLSVVPVRVVK